MNSIILNTTFGKSFNPAITSYLLKVGFALLLLFWCAGIFYHFLAVDNTNYIVSTFLKHTYSTVCHQAEHKLIPLDGSNTYLCARCTGIYIGAFFMAVSLLLINKKISLSLKPLIITSSIILFDVIFVNTGLYNYTNWIAFTSGFLFGAVIYIYIVQVFVENMKLINPKKIL